MYKLLIPLLLTTTINATDKIVLMTVSKHSQDNEYYNNQNYGLGYEFTSEHNIGYHLGAYHNSYYKPTVYIGLHYHKEILKDLTIGTEVNLATGYKVDTGYRVLPTPTISIRYKWVRLVTSYPFASMVNSDDVINLQFVWEIR